MLGSAPIIKKIQRSIGAVFLLILRGGRYRLEGCGSGLIGVGFQEAVSMHLTIEPSKLSGSVPAPGSKSHMIRATVIASLAEGRSTILRALDSLDTQAALRACRALGANIEVMPDAWIVDGVAGQVATPDNVIDVGNSGTTLYIALSMAALGYGAAVFTGDDQIRARPAENLLVSLRDLGASAFSTRGSEGMCPILVRGPMTGGKTVIECPTSQYLTSLLISAPLAQDDTTIDVPLLNEKPYVEMTLGWLERQGIKLERQGLSHFHIYGGQRYHSFEAPVPGDFSSATFFLVAGALGDNDVTVTGLDMDDSQGDKAVVEMLRAMGAKIAITDGSVRVSGGELTGGEFDLNATPDALPAMAVAGCFARGATRLHNVPQARMKETDRIAVMREVLSVLGAKVLELPDGLVVEQSDLHGGPVHGHGDHRVVMALAAAATAAKGPVTIDTAEAASITFPGFTDLLAFLGAGLRLSDDADNCA